MAGRDLYRGREYLARAHSGTGHLTFVQTALLPGPAA